MDFQNLELPKGSKIISVIHKNYLAVSKGKRIEQYDGMVLYAIVDTDSSETELYDIAVKGTGHDFPEKLDTYTFLDSVKLMNGSLVFHVFYKKVEE